MNINRDNYEAWLLDLMEGRLTPEQEQELHDFLLLHPDCAAACEELDAWDLDSWELDAGDSATGSMSYSEKSDLKKELPHPGSLVSEKHFDLFSIARMEGDLTDRQVEEHQRIVNEDTTRQEEWLEWKQTRLVAEPVIFEGKDKIKRNTGQRSRVLWISIASAAAALFLFFAIFIADRGEPVPGELVSLEKEVFPDSDVEQKTSGEEKVLQRDSEISKTSASRNIPVSGTFDTGSFSIKKHQDPPELTGVKRDTVSHQVKKESLRPGPVRIAMLEKALMPVSPDVRKDKIEPLDLPVLSATSGKSTFQQLSEKGLRQVYREFLEENDISLLTIASAGIDGINLLAGSDLSLNLSRDDKGKVSGFSFKGDYLSVDTPVKKEE